MFRSKLEDGANGLELVLLLATISTFRIELRKYRSFF